jgi:branched-subunit amino acid transport protein
VAPVTAVWVTIAGLTISTALIKASGPLLVGGRSLPPTALRVIALLAPALLGALVVTQTFSHDGELVFDARAAGLAAAAVAVWFRASLITTIVVAAVATAAVRAIT